MRQMRWLVMAAAIGGLLAGCAESRTRTGEAPDAGSVTAAARWPFWPTRMRFHPLTRLATDAETGTTIIEARLELFDRDDFTTRGYGEVRIDLHDRWGRTGHDPIQMWEMDLKDLEANRERYDPVTRTYLLRLEPEPGHTLPEDPVLWGYFMSADGTRLGEESIRLRSR